MFSMRHFARLAAPAAACLLGLAVVSAQAAPFDSVDGAIGSTEYAVGSTDANDAGSVFYNTDLDIDRVQFRNEIVDGNSVFFMGFDTIGGSFDFGSASNPTDVRLTLFDDAGNDQALAMFKFEGLVAGGSPNAVTLLDENFLQISVPGDEMSTVADNDFEFGIFSSHLSDVIPESGSFTFAFELELSDSGSTQGDQHSDILTTSVPEPTTLALVGLGAAFLIPRRRRR